MKEMSPTRLAANMYLLASKAALHDRLLTAWDQLVVIFTNLLLVIVVFILARYIAKFIQRRIWRRFPIDEVTPATESLVNNSVAVAFYALAFTASLAFLGASWSSLLTAFSVSTIAVVFGLQDLLKSILGGAFLILERPYEVGDRIKVRDNEGEVTEIGVRTTTLITDGRATVIFPNSLHLSEPMSNLDRTSQIVTIIHVIGITGNLADTKAMIEAILQSEPAIASTLSLSSNTRHGRLNRIFGAMGTHQLDLRRRKRLDDPAAIRARIELRVDEAVSRMVDADAKKRLQQAFPDAIVTVRRSSLAHDNGSDNDERRDVD